MSARFSVPTFAPAIGLDGVRAQLRAIGHVIGRAGHMVVTRRALVELDDRMLADIGTTHDAALREAARAPWDLEQPRRHPRPQPQPQPPARAPAPRPALLASLRAALRRRHSRMLITSLDAHMLKDIGVSYGEAEEEANKPLWRM